jgi:hypothetical protein
MTFTDFPGVTGAKQATFHELNVRNMLRDLGEASPNMTKAELYSTFLAQAESDPRIMQVIFDYWFSNAFKAIWGEKPGPEPIGSAAPLSRPLVAGGEIEPADKALHRGRKTRAEVEEKLNENKQFLFDMMMPNHKPLRNNTREDLQVVNGWTSGLIELLEPHQKVKSLGIEKVWAVWAKFAVA